MGDIYEQIGAKIRELRSGQGGGRRVSQEALARAVGTTSNTISRWETATYKPSVEDLEKISRFFGVPITSFFPSIDPNVRLHALLSATGDLDDRALDEVTRYALFRRARTELKVRTKRVPRK